ncbi:MAG TPA: GDSL-type esterase/lipase family protein [Pyrinomonadaceae bacterium]|nr:GDSL-type esterase/lipase family protein [Pyrinomonadaceae bacterium]
MLQPASLEAPLSTVIPVDQEQHGFVNSVALTSFFRQLTAIENHSRSRQIRIVQYGDSHTKVDLFTGAVRKNFLRDFGGDAASLVKKTSYRPSSGGSSMSVYQPMGINGARAKRLRDMSESASFLQSLSQSRPDLIVLAYGTNEVTDGDWTVDSYSRMLVGIMTRLRSAAPNAAILMIGPPDRSVMGSGGWTSVKRMSLLLEAQRRAAYLGNAALWSEYDAMGGAGSMNEWVGSGLGRFDHVHFTAAGYSRLARLFYTDLISLYRGEQPEHSPLVQGLDLRAMRGVPPSVTKP